MRTSPLDRTAHKNLKVHYLRGHIEIGLCGIDAPHPQYGTREPDDVTCRRCLRIMDAYIEKEDK